MSNGDREFTQGILKCRDLVQLYYGVRMVTSRKIKQFGGNPTAPVQMYTVDPSRIRVEIFIANQDVAPQSVQLGETAEDAFGDGQFISVLAGSTIEVERNFLTDLDLVTSALFILPSSANVVISTRETFLTPVPVDEI